MPKEDFYVYLLLDTSVPAKIDCGLFCLTCMPFYVGKGRGNRASSHLKEATVWNTKQSNSHKISKIKKMLSKNVVPEIFKAKTGLNECDALRYEESLILLIGSHTRLTNKRTSGWVTKTNTKKRGAASRKLGTKLHTVKVGNEIIQVDAAQLQTIPHEPITKRPRKTGISESKKRRGSSNGMFGKSAVKGSRWVIIDGISKFMTADEIDSLRSEFVYGRLLDYNKHRCRIFIEGDTQAKYVNRDLSDVPNGVTFQYGLTWKTTKETFIKVNDNVIPKN